MLNKSRELIKKVCVKNNIEYKLLSKDWIIMLKKDDKTRFISGCKFGLNDHAIGEAIDDKYALYEVLKELDIPVAEHNILYSKDNKNSYALDSNDYNIVKEFFHKYQDIVLKPCKGTCGSDVYHITNLNEIDDVLNNLFSKYTTISYCPFYNIKNEYRLITLNGNIELVYKKIRPIVIGNGVDSLRKLLLRFNYEYFDNKLDDNEYDYILKDGEVYEYSWKFNLSNGARASFEIDDNIKIKLEIIAKDVLNKLKIGFASIDVIETDDGFMVLELNSGVMVENIMQMIDDISVIENLYEKAILLMFNE